MSHNKKNNKDMVPIKDIRAWCRNKYGSSWWDVSPELKKNRKKEAETALKCRDIVVSPLPPALQPALPPPPPALPLALPPALPTQDDWSNIESRQKITQDLFDKFNKQHLNNSYELSFNSRAKNLCGRCWIGKKKIIEITTAYMVSPHITLEHIKETILHEIAHALTPGDGHGKKWKQMAIRIGCSGNRCAGKEEIFRQPKYIISCPCKKTHCGRDRLSNNIKSGRLACASCNGKLVVTENTKGIYL